MSWRGKKIGALCVAICNTDPRQKPDELFRYIDISGIDRDLKCIASTAEILGGEAPSRARQVVAARDVVVSTVRPNLNAVALVPDDLEGAIASTGFCVLRVVEQILEPRFLFYFTRTDTFIDALLQHVRGANYPAVADRNVRDIEIPWPAKSEQQRIVNILDQVDALRGQRRTADDKARRILPALFYKMFGDPSTNPKGWPVRRLGDVTLGKPQYGANASSKAWAEGDPRYVRITDISDDGRLLKTGITTLALDEWEHYRLTEGDLLFARSGNTVGKTYLYRPDDGLCAYAGYLIRFKPDLDQVAPWYLFALTQTDYYRDWVDARKRVAGQPNINAKEYASLEIPCPPPPLQRSFTHLAESYVDIRNGRELTADQLDHLFEVVLHRAFTGDLTAKWREAHKEQLETEMQSQMAVFEDAQAKNPKCGRRRKAVD